MECPQREGAQPHRETSPSVLCGEEGGGVCGLVSPVAGTDPAPTGKPAASAPCWMQGMRDWFKASGGAGLGAWLCVGVWLSVCAPDMCSKIVNMPQAFSPQRGCLAHGSIPISLLTLEATLVGS